MFPRYIRKAAFMRAAHLEREGIKREHRRRERAARISGSSGVTPISEYLKFRVEVPDREGIGLRPRDCDIHMG